MSYAFATLSINNFVVYVQKQSVGTRFLSKNERNILKPKLSRFGEISVLQQNRIVYSNSVFHQKGWVIK